MHDVCADQHTLVCDVHGRLCEGRAGASSDDEPVDGVC